MRDDIDVNETPASKEYWEVFYTEGPGTKQYEWYETRTPAPRAQHVYMLAHHTLMPSVTRKTYCTPHARYHTRRYNLSATELAPAILPHIQANARLLQVGVGNSLIFENLAHDALWPDGGVCGCM